MKRDTLDALLARIREHRPVVLATRMGSDEQAILMPLEPGDAAAAPGAWPLDAARRALVEDRSITVDHEGSEIFLRPYNPPIRLVVVGAAHIAAPLVQMAVAAGLATLIVDPRSAFATEERFPGTELVREWPQDALPGLGLDHRTAVVTLTHDAKLDDPALAAALESDAFYIGALGSRRTHAKRLERLREAGFSAESLERIHAPIGLDIGARTPAEIAVSILAELVGLLRGRPAP